MALCFFNRTVHKRGRKTPSRLKAQYILREGVYAVPEKARVKHLDHTPGGKHVRDDLVEKDVHNLPRWAPDAIAFFTMAEQHERSRGVISTEWKFALPRELSRAQQLDAARDFMASQLGETHPYVWAMHEPHADDGQAQPHVHCLWSSRTLDGIDRAPEQFFRRYNREHPEKGGAQKDVTLTTFGVVYAARHAYADVMNFHLERAGVEARLHPASLEARGFERTPEPRMLPSDSNKARYHGELTEGWAKVRAHRQARQEHDGEEQALARQAWEARKAELLITNVHALHRTAFVAQVRWRTAEMARNPRPRPTLDELQAEATAHTAKLAALDAHLTTLQRARQGKEVPMRAVIAAMAAGVEEAPRSGLRMKLYEDEGYGGMRR